MYMVHILLYFVVIYAILPLSFRITSLALGQQLYSELQEYE